jgi:hypothetical protein
MAFRVGIVAPKPSKYYSVENFLGAGATYGGIYVLEHYIMPQVSPRIPLTGDALAVANIAVKSLVGFGAFYGARKTTGLASDALSAVSFGCTISAVADIVNLAVSKMKATVAPRVVPRATYSPPPVTVTPSAPAAPTAPAPTPVAPTASRGEL